MICERNHLTMPAYILFMLMVSSMVMSCPTTGEHVSTWNDNLSTMHGRITSWMHHPDGQLQESGRFDIVTGTFTFGVFEGNISVGLAWQSRTNRRMDGFLYGKVDHYGNWR